MIYRLIIENGIRRFTVVTLGNLSLPEYIEEHKLDYKYSDDLDAIVLVPADFIVKKETIIKETDDAQ